MNKTSEISDFFNNQTIFVTGATGFLGKVLIEKLLRSCGGLKKIYILVRIKKGTSQEERFKEIFKSPCFDPLRKIQPNFMEKVSLIKGDCCDPYMGISESDQETLIKEVSCIFHEAATVRFDQHLKTATWINVRATRDLLEMAKNMANLKAFVHVSTAYSYAPLGDIKEKYYDPPISGENLIKVMGILDDDCIANITEKLIKNWPNTYAFTKAVAEEMIRTNGDGLPIALVRPAIVCNSWKEPLSGWTDSYYGAIGVGIGSAVGLIRVIPAYSDNKNDIVPADFVTNLTLASAWNVGQCNIAKNATMSKHVELDISSPGKKTFSTIYNRDEHIFNLVSQKQKPLDWKGFSNSLYKANKSVPMEQMIWKPFTIFAPCPYYYAMLKFLIQTLPAYFIDLCLREAGKKPQMVDAYKNKIDKFMDVLSYFTMRKFVFSDEKAQMLYQNMSKVDKELFNFSFLVPDFTWEDYLDRCNTGAKIYILKEKMETLDWAKRKALYFSIAHYALCTFLVYGLVKFVLLLANMFS